MGATVTTKMGAMGTPKPRRALDAIASYTPGKAAETVMREQSLDSAVKLASNENPFSPLPSVLAAIDGSAAASLNRYADHRAVAVRRALAARYGLEPANVAVGCGSVGVLQQVLLAYVDPGDEVLYNWRTFEAYPIATALVGGVEVAVPTRFEALDIPALAKAVTERTRVVFVCSPNNPTGTVVAEEELLALLDAVPDDCLVVLDEAYHEYVTAAHAPDALAVLDAHPNLAVLRTFSKAYGLAALRIGYLLGHPEVAASVDKALTPFAVNGLAQAAALASLEADEELSARVDETLAERERVAGALRRRGYSVPDAQANFVWLPAGATAAALAAAMERRGVVARPFPGDGVRVTVGAPEENDRFLAAFEAAASEADLTASWRLPTGALAGAVQDVVDRIDAADARLCDHAVAEHAGLTDPDPGGTERWDDAQVWAHLAEIGGYWRGELAKVVDAASAEPVPFGRVKTDAARVAAIETGRNRPVAENLAAVRRSLDALRAYVSGLSAAEWGRVGRHETLGDMTVARQLDEFHIGHVEQHLAQLDGLASGA
jgi:histidinol-phosphate aminotransferase